MQEFTSRMSFILFFLILTLIIQMVFGDKVTTNFLWLVLLSMIIVQKDKFINLLGKVAK